MKATFKTNASDVQAAFQRINRTRDVESASVTYRVLEALACESSTREAILPPTVGWFSLHIVSDSDETQQHQLQILGSNTEGILCFAIVRNTETMHLCELHRGQQVHLEFADSPSVAILHYDGNAVLLSVIVDRHQCFTKTLIHFTGQVPRSKIGKGQPVAKPLDDRGVNRTYLDHSLVNSRGEMLKISFARTEHAARITYPKHAHVTDNVRIVCSGVYRFQIFDPDTDVVVHECVVASGETIQIPARYAYIEEVVDPGVVINGRSTDGIQSAGLHYKMDTPAKLLTDGDITMSY